MPRTIDYIYIYIFAYWSLLVLKYIFKEVFVSFLLVGHTHDDIDASFGRWTMKLRGGFFNHPTIDEVVHESG